MEIRKDLQNIKKSVKEGAKWLGELYSRVLEFEGDIMNLREENEYLKQAVFDICSRIKNIKAILDGDSPGAAIALEKEFLRIEGIVSTLS
ncbi:MAG: hypothetical protein WCQ97_10520 [Aminobacterium sp.]